MKSLTRKLILTVLIFLSINTFAVQTIYQWQSENGELNFSDTPHEGAKEKQIKEVNTYIPTAQKPKTEKINKEKSFQYDSFKISDPINNTTLRNNNGNVQVTLIIEPSLKINHFIQYYLDGKKISKPSKKIIFELLNIDRGTHTLSAQILNESDDVITTSNAVTIFIHRQFLKRI